MELLDITMIVLVEKILVIATSMPVHSEGLADFGKLDMRAHSPDLSSNQLSTNTTGHLSNKLGTHEARLPSP